MSQAFTMDESAFADLQQRQAELLERFVGRQHLPTGEVRLTEVVSGVKLKDVYDRLDDTQARMKEAGATMIHRTKIGRNATCPCGSGRKFKKCCIDRAQLVGVS